MNTNRRQFLITTAAAGAACLLPVVVTKKFRLLFICDDLTAEEHLFTQDEMIAYIRKALPEQAVEVELSNNVYNYTFMSQPTLIQFIEVIADNIQLITCSNNFHNIFQYQLLQPGHPVNTRLL